MKKKIIIILTVSAIITISAILIFVARGKNSAPTTVDNIPVVEADPPDLYQIEIAKNTQRFSGTLQELNDQAVVVLNQDGTEYRFVVNGIVDWQIGPDYISADVSDYKIGSQVEVLYNQQNDELISLWQVDL